MARMKGRKLLIRLISCLYVWLTKSDPKEQDVTNQLFLGAPLPKPHSFMSTYLAKFNMVANLMTTVTSPVVSDSPLRTMLGT